jgi:hypothetical protein
VLDATGQSIAGVVFHNASVNVIPAPTPAIEPQRKRSPAQGGPRFSLRLLDSRPLAIADTLRAMADSAGERSGDTNRERSALPALLPPNAVYK